MEIKTLILGSRGSGGNACGRKLRFVTTNPDGTILMRLLDGTPVPQEMTDHIALSLGGVDSLLHKCFVFNGTEEEFLALPISKRGICWREINKRWVDYMISIPPNEVQVGFIIDGLRSQEIYSSRGNKRKGKTNP